MDRQGNDSVGRKEKMDQKERVRIITLADLWEQFLQHAFVIIMVAGFVVLAVFLYSRYVQTPTYQSKATLYILRRENESDYVYTQSDFSLAKDVVNDCTYVIKSKETLDDVIKKLDLDINCNHLAAKISTNNPENTRFLEVTVTDINPKEAKKIVDCVCEIGSKKITDAMGFDQVNLYSYGDIPTRRSNGVGFVRYLILGAITAAIVYALFLVFFLMDTNIRSEEDITKYLGISVLAEIPNAEGNSRRGGKYRYGNRYRRYETYRYNSANTSLEGNGEEGNPVEQIMEKQGGSIDK